MTISAGSRLGPYEILEPLGAGGMGEVYKGRDTRLDRLVAIKVLPAHLTEDVELKQRFDREARAISSLSHPNICALFDVGHQGGVDYLVMELLEGESLAKRLTRGPLPMEEALRHAIAIAEALDRAHQQRIVHRDLKPQNLMITKSGIKLLDFGLAKLAPAAAGPVFTGLSSLPTDPGKHLTQTGMILGTFQYMAPEQLEGKDVDPRTDIFGFGAVLYEMLTGLKAFTGQGQASLIAAILSTQPTAVSAIVPMTPPALDRVVQRCLAKDPEDRWQTARDLLFELRWLTEAGSRAGVPTPVVVRRRDRERLAWIAAGVLGLAATAFAYGYFRRAPIPRSPVRFVVLPPARASFNPIDGPVTLSLDGRNLVFAAAGADGRPMLWLRPLDTVDARELPGTDDAFDPFFSADGRSLGFFEGGQLQRLELAGGPPRVVAAAIDGRGGTWNRNGTIVFAASWRGPLSSVPAAGGSPQVATALDDQRREIAHMRPHFLPDGEHFLFLARSADPDKSSLRIGRLGETQSEHLLDLDAPAVYAPPGFLLYVRERTLLARPFDPGSRKLRGEPFAVAEPIFTAYANGVAGVSAAENGAIAFQGAGGMEKRLTWFDRLGNPVGSLGPPGEYRTAEFSRDGSRVAVERYDRERRSSDIWVIEVATGAASQITSHRARDRGPVWSPDATRLLFHSDRDGPGDLFVRSSSAGNVEESKLYGSLTWKYPNSWSRDGEHILFQSFDPRTKRDVWVMRAFSTATEPVPLLRTEADEWQAAFSPDAKWVAYCSNESGAQEVYVSSFPGPGGKWQVSSAGGAAPRWREDGRELFYLAPDRRVMASDIKPDGAAFQFSPPRALFQAPTEGAFAVMPDGGRFLLQNPETPGREAPIQVFLDWAAGRSR
jgi:Tol biopolymer transport system component